MLASTSYESPPGGFGRTPGAWLRLRNEVARGQHISTRLRIVRGDAGPELTRPADHAEVIVIGARMNGHGTPLNGDTVPTVLSGAPCEVIICEDGTTRDD